MQKYNRYRLINLIGAVVFVIIFASLAVYSSRHNNSNAAPVTPVGVSYVTPPSNCVPNTTVDQSACLRPWLASLHPGSVWNATNQYWEVDHGLGLKDMNNIVIEGGTFHTNQTSAYKGPNGHKLDQGIPVFLLYGGSNISFSNVTITGDHIKGGLSYGMADQSGIRIDGTQNVTLTNITAEYLFGDGLNFEPLLGDGGTVSSRSSGVITNYFAQRNGRFALVPLAAQLTVNNMTSVAHGYGTIDAEDDSGNTVPGNLTFNNLKTDGGFELSASGSKVGPISINNWTQTGTPSSPVLILNKYGSRLVGAVSITNSSLNCGGISAYYSCFQIEGVSSMVVKNVSITVGYPHYVDKEPLYAVGANSSVQFINDRVSCVNGTHDCYGPGRNEASSNVSVSGGNFPTSSSN